MLIKRNEAMMCKTKYFVRVTLLIVVLVNISCNKQVFDIYGDYNHQIFQSYIVDTIKIDNPIIIEYKNIFYVLEKKYFNNNLESVIKSDYVFVLGSDLYHDIYHNQRKGTWPIYEDYGGCNYSRDKSLQYATFKKNPCYYILALINSRYYIKIHTSIDVPIGFSSYGPLNNEYIKVVYPVCCE
jgi:hypothetical protein